MTLAEKILFMEDFIEQFPDVTIGEYLEALNEIEQIEKRTADIKEEISQEYNNQKAAI